MNNTNPSTNQFNKTIPGPSDCSQMWEDPLTFLANATQEYGDIICLNDNSNKIYMINHPDYIKHVLQDNYRNYVKTEDTLKLVVGDGLFVSEGEYWLRHRRIMQPSFHRQHLAKLFPIMRDTTATFLEGWQSKVKYNHPINVLAEMKELLINFSAKTMFSVAIEDTNLLANAINTSIEYIDDYSEDDLDTFSEKKLNFEKSLATLNKIIYQIINERRDSKKDEGDLLSMLLQAKDEETGEGLSDKELRDEIVAIWLGSLNTSAVVLTWIFYIFSTYPNIENHVRIELAQMLNNHPLTLEDLPKLRYTRMVIDETLRLYPPAWLFFRRSVVTDTIGGYNIPANSIIYISPYLMHRHPSFWKQPEIFDPERFSAERSSNYKSFSYLPFGGGPHQCIGNNFALMSIPVILTIVMQSYNLTWANETPIKPQATILLQPQSELIMNLRSIPKI